MQLSGGCISSSYINIEALLFVLNWLRTNTPYCNRYKILIDMLMFCVHTAFQQIESDIQTEGCLGYGLAVATRYGDTWNT